MLPVDKDAGQGLQSYPRLDNILPLETTIWWPGVGPGARTQAGR